MLINTINAGALQGDTLPNHCPVCLRKIEPIDYGNGVLIGDWIDKIYRCPSQQCGRLFIARYQVNRFGPGTARYDLRELHPEAIAATEYSETISNVSPAFVSIVRQAEAAERLGLKLVCGPGYRKALEFLVKDYVIRSHQTKADEIKSLNLAQCITNYVSDERVKRVSARAVWLGNDETHYLRKWEDKDLNDLKMLIGLTVHWIEMDELTKNALNDMPEGKA
jgi:hypothetical protein